MPNRLTRLQFVKRVLSELVAFVRGEDKPIVRHIQKSDGQIIYDQTLIFGYVHGIIIQGSRCSVRLFFRLRFVCELPKQFASFCRTPPSDSSTVKAEKVL
jgi:hypothetical protein